ncbi:molybdopterin converting factor subunit 1 [Chitinimonas viridis]|uniref:Molybdopterin synthase sulfur carrier subunit n=2 Tax=Chitinimonas TaxID=240411 RepID=A0ABT8B095_9NEIS|nr:MULTISPECIES: molybdopterin converting factor subunit 1 [Chitinimonas]MDN3575526.1 molybdopterin converting factor subunit 1 [Chitinimonas viridis]GLR11279.1 molybdopterin synthase sulfur carrier subunit [Chitinimonas prasina]
MQVTLLYFARLRERFGMAEEQLSLPEGIQTVAGLIAHLAARGDVWAEELAGERVYRVALDQEMADFSAQLHHGAEVAVFPPVTGG